MSSQRDSGTTIELNFPTIEYIFMNLDNAYLAYINHPTETTLTGLYDDIRRYAETLARRWRHPDPTDAASGAVGMIWPRIGSFVPTTGHSFTAWVKTITVNLILKDWKKHRPTVSTDLDTLPPPSIVRTFFVVNELTHLTPAERETVTILIQTGCFDETANQLRISKRTLQKRLSKIKCKSQGQFSRFVTST